MQEADNGGVDHGRLDNKSLVRLITWGQQAGVLQVGTALRCAFYLYHLL